MKNTITKKLVGMILAVLICTTFAQIRVIAQENVKTEDQNNQISMEQRDNDRSLVGVWETVVTPRNCTTGVPVAPDFQSLVTFNTGGTLAEFAAGGNPVLRSPGHGIWKRTNGWRNYSLRIVFLRFNTSGAYIGKQRITQTVELSANGNQSTSSGTVEILDPNGNVLGSGCSTSTAARFE